MTTITLNITTTIDDVLSEFVVTGSGQALYSNRYSDNVRRGYSFIGQINTHWAGVRFRSITIPQGSTINSAILTTHTTGGPTGTANVKVYANNVDNASPWGTTNRVKNITKTAGANVTRSSGFVNTDVTAIVQGIVNRAGWSSGNSMEFGFFQTAANLTANWGFDDLSYGAGTPAQLVIDYTAGAAAGGPLVNGGSLTKGALIRGGRMIA